MGMKGLKFNYKKNIPIIKLETIVKTLIMVIRIKILRKIIKKTKTIMVLIWVL